MRKVLVIMVSIVALSVGAQRARGDDTLSQLQRQVDEIRRSQGIGTSPSDRKISASAKKAAAEAERIMNQVPPTQAPVASPLPVTHIRAEGGVPFPKQEEVVFEPFEFKTPTPDPHYVPWEGPRYRRPGRCDRSNTEKLDFPNGASDTPEEILLDQLYLPEDYVPVDSSDVFGSRTALFPYGSNSGEGVYTHMETDNVPCVPFRIRITTTTMYRQSGNDALRNYDKKLSGKGEFHPWIQQKLFGTK